MVATIDEPNAIGNVELEDDKPMFNQAVEKVEQLEAELARLRTENDAVRIIFDSTTKAIDYDKWIEVVNERDSMRAKLEARDNECKSEHYEALIECTKELGKMRTENADQANAFKTEIESYQQSDSILRTENITMRLKIEEHEREIERLRNMIFKV